MILVDTSVWVTHFRQGHPELTRRLEAGEVACHPFIVGELACGNLKNRRAILSLLRDLPQVAPANDEEVLRFIEDRRMMGKGLGYIDMHLLAAALLSHTPLWTLDKKLREAARELGIGYEA
ncbi:MAG: type II toxin-antitoxin system VapC family toxin [Candidatus Omnitrophica bacterium]|nr:type II toxin-antitoxin system VapC family toxin [Candidatus Omnitrophota bacterium]